jgi:hypothetical protein
MQLEVREWLGGKRDRSSGEEERTEVELAERAKERKGVIARRDSIIEWSMKKYKGGRSSKDLTPSPRLSL